MPTQIQTQATPFLQSPTASKPTSIMGKDDFLRLLVMQLRFQDPMNPLKGTEFAAQLAQFSSVEQLSNIKTSLEESLRQNGLLAQSINNALSATLLDKQVRATADALWNDGSGTVRFGYTLPVAADSVVVTLRDASGTVIKTFRNANTQKGESFMTWDGTDDRGRTVAEGQYTIHVEARNAQGETISAEPFIVGKVRGIRFKADGGVVVIGEMEVPLARILEVRRDEQ
jgi:flagellar basal-body rod modification protein FlgD